MRETPLSERRVLWRRSNETGAEAGVANPDRQIHACAAIARHRFYAPSRVVHHGLAFARRAKRGAFRISPDRIRS
jgi:hypothetical protein